MKHWMILIVIVLAVCSMLFVVPRVQRLDRQREACQNAYPTRFGLGGDSDAARILFDICMKNAHNEFFEF